MDGSGGQDKREQSWREFHQHFSPPTFVYVRQWSLKHLVGGSEKRLRRRQLSPFADFSLPL
jgi:hypothetical protein